MVKVVLIDTGLSDEYDDSRITGGCSIVTNGDAFEIRKEYTDYIGHGTATADIILKYSQNVNIYIVRIYEKDLYISEEKLCFALEYVREHLTYDMIQISSGILNYSFKMHEIIRKIVEEDHKLILSAFDNEGGISYPAAFEEVLGIDVNLSYRKKEQYDIVDENVIDVRGGDSFFRVPWINKGKNIVKGSSFLTSYYTAWCGDHCDGNLNKPYVINELKKHAIHIYGGINIEWSITSSEFVKNIKHAITFPFNKEIYCLAAFEEMLPFKIDGYYDIKHKFIVGKKIKEILKYTDNKALIQNVDNIDWNGDFDTVICGHLSEISEMTKKDYLMEILQLCQKYNKRAYVFDDLGLLDENYRNTENLFSPIISINPSLHNRFGKLRVCNKPVLAVMGTSSRQGKYTIQLKLMKEFKERGINVDGIATEPTGGLFGFSEMYACGYGSNNNLASREMVRVINDMVYRIERTNAELIITGGQSGTVAYDMRNESLIPFEQYCYLTGVNPDGVILCVNEIDDLHYVKRTINYIEAVSSASVFAIVISPVRKSQNDSVNKQNMIELLQKEYGESKKYYRLDALDVKALADNIIQYYD